MECSGGEGIILLLKETIILLLRCGVEGRLWHSPYLDSHKEEDQGLKRGKPIFLEPSRYLHLRE